MNATNDDSVVEIDKNRLDEEWVNQPRLRLIWGKKLADARNDLDELKRELTVVRAEVGKAIRTMPDSYGIAKLTENALEAALTMDAVVAATEKKVNEAKHDVDVLGAYCAAIDDRKWALQNLVQLHGADYFAAPKQPTDNPTFSKAAGAAKERDVNSRLGGKRGEISKR